MEANVALSILRRSPVTADGFDTGTFLRLVQRRSSNPTTELVITLRSGNAFSFDLFEVIGDSLVGCSHGGGNPRIIPFHAIDMLEITNA